MQLSVLLLDCITQYSCRLGSIGMMILTDCPIDGSDYSDIVGVLWHADCDKLLESVQPQPLLGDVGNGIFRRLQRTHE